MEPKDPKPPLSLEEFIAKIETSRQMAGVDLSTAEDLSLAVMNLISLEEHFFFTAMKTGQDEYLETGAEIRKMRKELLAELMPNHQGETWCASKHLLATTMRLIEVANKLQSENKKAEALKSFQQAYQIYSIFWALKLKLINVDQIKTTATSSHQLENLVTKLANCCEE